MRNRKRYDQSLLDRHISVENTNNSRQRAVYLFHYARRYQFIYEYRYIFRTFAKLVSWLAPTRIYFLVSFPISVTLSGIVTRVNWSRWQEKRRLFHQNVGLLRGLWQEWDVVFFSLSRYSRRDALDYLPRRKPFVFHNRLAFDHLIYIIKFLKRHVCF